MIKLANFFAMCGRDQSDLCDLYDLRVRSAISAVDDDGLIDDV